MVWGNVTDHANFVLNDQAHLVARSATTTGVEDQAVAWAHFLAGPEVQARVGIDRGHMSCFKAVADDAAATAPPPEGMHHLFTYPESPYVRHDRWCVPGGNFHELRAEWRPVLDTALVGEVDAVQSMLHAAEKGQRHAGPLARAARQGRRVSLIGSAPRRARPDPLVGPGCDLEVW